MGVGDNSLKKAVFLDRDGVINEAVVRDGKPYPPQSVAETVIGSGVARGLQLLKDSGFELAVVTNQPDVARGTQVREKVEEINAYLASILPIDYFAVCYHDDSSGCECRKPRPGLIKLAARELGVDISRSFLVGDRWRDIEAGLVAGCKTVWLDRGYDEKSPIGFDFRVVSMIDAAHWIIDQRGS
jgi:D-glycero-D-manno-heptose 1,7-bisphosphate phosphatase